MYDSSTSLMCKSVEVNVNALQETHEYFSFAKQVEIYKDVMTSIPCFMTIIGAPFLRIQAKG